MQWNLLFAVVCITVAANATNDQTSSDEGPAFPSSDEVEKEWTAFKIKYGNHMWSIIPRSERHICVTICNDMWSKCRPICTSGCLPVGYRWIQTRRNLSGSALPNNFRKLDLPMLTERFPSFAFHSSAWNLGVVLDSTLTFSEHVANLTRSSYFHLRRLRAIKYPYNIA